MTLLKKIITSIKLSINERADGLQASIDDLKESVDFIHAEMKEVQGKLAETISRVGKTEEKVLHMDSKLIDLSRYKRRWDLRLSGLSEEEGEDVRNKVISICQKTAPGCKEKLPDVINTVHRLGRVTGSARPREVIIQFSMRHYRDMIWKAAKQSSFLKTHNLRFKEDFPPEDRQKKHAVPTSQKST
ncbi:hypothetical protein GOODEAATRI_004182 [Goodea atripinnis]|uniref:L1 transposable element RRM domain-containing protein n=1 Tax=Goodea atripinnis TaxID=208336 RepID=A0ABV0PKS0_9TELE